MSYYTYEQKKRLYEKYSLLNKEIQEPPEPKEPQYSEVDEEDERERK